MIGTVTKPYQRPYEDPLSVRAGEPVTPDFGKRTDIAGWVWCTGRDGRAGWTPRSWLMQADGTWRVDRDFDAIELTVAVGDRLDIIAEAAGFYWARPENGAPGWVPCDHVGPLEPGQL